MSRNGIAVIERGGNVTLHSLKAIADALGMELEIRVKKDDTALDAAGDSQTGRVTHRRGNT